MRPYFLWMLLTITAAACAQVAPGTASPIAGQPDATAEATAPLPTFTAMPPSPTAPPTASALATPLPPSPEPEEVELCSPLAGVPIANLADRITNPFNPPPPGSDDPHQGADFADFLPGTRIAVPGLPVQAVLAGRVAMRLDGNFPYGNALLVETPLGSQAFTDLDLPDPLQGLPLHTTLTCPSVTEFAWDDAGRSLYLLYAHLENTPSYGPGDAVACGAEIGKIGNSGNSLNPHLHLELRVGSSGASFAEMGHYDASASAAAMNAYCAWRVSGHFLVLDPGLILQE